MNDDTTPTAPAGVLQMKAVTASYVCGSVAIASVTTLVISLSVRDVDALAAVALAFGIVAFIAQLAISIAQFSSAERSQTEVGRINAETQAALTDLRAVQAEMLHSQRDLVERLIGQAIAQVQGEATTPDEAAFAERIEANLLGLEPKRVLPRSDRDLRAERLTEQVRSWILGKRYEAYETTNGDSEWDLPVIDIEGHIVSVEQIVEQRFNHSRDSAENYAEQWTRGYVLSNQIEQPVLTLLAIPSAPEDQDHAWRVENVVIAWPEVFDEVPGLLAAERPG